FTPESPQGGGAAGERGGLVRYDFELQPGDVEADDDRRSAYVFVSERPAGVALVSFRPDWEPRYLQPVLEQALGVPVRGFAFVGDGRYVRIAAGLEAGRRAGEVEVRQAVEQADLLVLHGLDATAPAWAREAAGRARRRLVFPGDGAPVGLPVEVSAPAPGEWYASSELPSSPLAGRLGTFRAEELPPPVGLRTVSGGGTWTAPVASRGRRGPTPPLVGAGLGGRPRRRLRAVGVPRRRGEAGLPALVGRARRLAGPRGAHHRGCGRPARGPHGAARRAGALGRSRPCGGLRRVPHHGGGRHPRPGYRGADAPRRHRRDAGARSGALRLRGPRLLGRAGSGGRDRAVHRRIVLAGVHAPGGGA